MSTKRTPGLTYAEQVKLGPVVVSGDRVWTAHGDGQVVLVSTNGYGIHSYTVKYDDGAERHVDLVRILADPLPLDLTATPTTTLLRAMMRLMQPGPAPRQWRAATPAAQTAYLELLELELNRRIPTTSGDT